MEGKYERKVKNDKVSEKKKRKEGCNEITKRKKRWREGE